MVAVAVGPDRHVAVGTTRSADGQDVGMAWTSTDGVAWRRASTPMTGANPAGVILDRDGFVAWALPVVFWTSPDGMTWSRASSTPSEGDEQVTGVARLGNDLVAVGYAEIATGSGFVHEFRTWTSPDGRAWKSVRPITSVPWDGYVLGVTASDDALVAWGYARGGGEFPPATLRSTDGRRWEMGGVKPGSEGYLREGIAEIAGVGPRLVAVGHGLEGEAGSPPPLAAWTSGDGLTWKTAVFESGPATGWLLHVVRYEGEYVALGLLDLDPVIWRSVDGTTWTRSTSAPDAGRDGEAEGCAGGGRCPNTLANDLAAGPAGLVAVGGSNRSTGGGSAVVWIALGS